MTKVVLVEDFSFDAVFIFAINVLLILLLI